MTFDWKELTGYIVSFLVWFIGLFPGDCEEWTQLISLMIVFITLVFITIPQAFNKHRQRKAEEKNGKDL